MSKLENENPYTPPTEAGIPTTSVVEFCLTCYLWVLMPVTMLYAWVRYRDGSAKLSVREETAIEIVSWAQWPIVWLCVVGYLVYSS